ncbi:MAG: hypothetical protein ACLU3I_05695 [Acutalibacteraceae bacterium]
MAIAELQTRIDATTEEIRSLEAAQTPPPAAGQPAAPAAERSNNTMPMTNPERRWLGLTYQERDALLQAPKPAISCPTSAPFARRSAAPAAQSSASPITCCRCCAI